MNALQAFGAAFDVPRDPRSAEYRDGALRILKLRLEGVALPPCPFPMPSAQADAWWAGTDEGHRIANRVRDTGRA